MEIYEPQPWRGKKKRKETRERICLTFSISHSPAAIFYYFGLLLVPPIVSVPVLIISGVRQWQEDLDLGFWRCSKMNAGWI